ASPSGPTTSLQNLTLAGPSESGWEYTSIASKESHVTSSGATKTSTVGTPDSTAPTSAPARGGRVTRLLPTTISSGRSVSSTTTVAPAGNSRHSEQVSSWLTNETSPTEARMATFS